MQVAVIGLGRIGKNIMLHLLDNGVSVVAYNRTREKVDEVVAKGAIGAYTLSDIPWKWAVKPVVAILFVPAKVVDEILFGLTPPDLLLERGGKFPPLVKRGLGGVSETKGIADIFPSGSIIIDGGNSFFKDSQARYQKLQQKGIHFLDMGTSGGLEGARSGACLMVGGDEKVYTRVKPLLTKIACKDGLDYLGPSGAGHFVKMVHNAIEYGMMGAIAEGMNLANSFQPTANSNNPTQPPLSQRGGKEGFKIDLAKLARVWSHGSIVSGLLMDKTAQALTQDPELNLVAGEVPRGETEVEMEWISTTGIPHPVIAASVKERQETRQKPSFIGKVIAALRHEFGGHKVKTVNSESTA